MAAREDESDPVILHRTLLYGLVRCHQQQRLSLAVSAGRVPPVPIDGPVPRGRDDPTGRARWHPGGRPPLDRRGESVLNRLLGSVDVAELPHEHRYRAPVLGAEHPVDVRRGYGLGHEANGFRSGRTSIGRPMISANRRPHMSASSRSGTWMMVKPPMCSLPSMYGPSVITMSPSRACSTVDVLGRCSPALKTHTPASFICWSSVASWRMIGASTSGGGGSSSGWTIPNRYCFIEPPQATSGHPAAGAGAGATSTRPARSVRST